MKAQTFSLVAPQTNEATQTHSRMRKAVRQEWLMNRPQQTETEIQQ